MRLAVIRPATAVVLLLLSAFLGTAAAQPAGKVPRVGYLLAGSHSDPQRQRLLEAFRQGLRELGYVEGQNIAIESRWAEGKDDRLPALAADLVRSKVDVIVALSGAITQAAQQRAGGRAPGSRGSHILVSAKTDRRARGEEAPPSDTWRDAGVRGGRRSHGL